MQKEIEEKAESILKGWLTQKPDNENQKWHREWILKLTERLRRENDLHQPKFDN